MTPPLRRTTPPSPARIPGFASSAISMSVTHWVVFAINLAGSILVARFLGPEGKGIYALVLLYVAIFVYFSNLGLPRAGAFFLSRREYAPADIWGHTLVYLAVIVAGIAAVSLAARPLLVRLVFPGVPPVWFGYALPIIIGQLVFTFHTMLLLGAHAIAGYNLVELLRGATLLAIGAGLVVAGYGVAGILTAESISWLAVGGLAALLVFRRVGAIATRYNPRYVSASLRYGLTVYLGDALYFFHYRTALALLSILASPAVVGLYSVAAAVAGTLSLLSQGAATVLFPRISSDPSGARDRELTPLVLRTVLLVSGAAAVALALVGPLLIRAAFGRAFSGSGPALLILLPGSVALCGWSILDSYFKGAGRAVWGTVTTGIAVIVGAVLSVWWIPRFGLLGASTATSAGYVAALGVALIAFRRLSGLSLSRTLLPRRGDLVLYAAVINQIRRPRMGEAAARGAPTPDRS